MATAQGLTSSTYGDAVFRKNDIDINVQSTPKFDAGKHMCFEAPASFTTLKELLLSDRNAISPVAITEPFPLFNLAGVKELRASAFQRDVVLKHARVFKPGVYKMRGYSKDAPFVDAAWRSQAVLDACSKAAGVDLDVVFDYEIGHLNVQIDELCENMDAIGDILPPAMPRRTELSNRPQPSVEDQLASVGNWHTDSYPWVCVCMLSDTTGMLGGETGLRKGDGSILKVRGPTAGWAVMMQGGCIDHIALKAFGTGERITMVTSFRPKDPLMRDGSTLRTVKGGSNCDELFLQWSTYRMGLISTRALAFMAKMEKEQASAEEIRTAVTSWVDEQTEYLKKTVTEMHV